MSNQVTIKGKCYGLNANPKGHLARGLKLPAPATHVKKVGGWMKFDAMMSSSAKSKFEAT